MTEHTHLLLERMREDEFYRTLEQRQRRHSEPRHAWRVRLATTLRHTADLLDDNRRTPTRDLTATR
ncbi:MULTISPECIES: hypothetical protein [Mumia]|uniref:hypothetical protein n=1 Tax=Mumia TaxID=1546255 RepID=UPI00141DE784|nr:MULTISPECIES: hypothetical protein [unclassified Mumia]QMW66118.1 hypothetical protein H4N58_18570 [Mumia sp. ZJ1417]